MEWFFIIYPNYPGMMRITNSKAIRTLRKDIQLTHIRAHQEQIKVTKMV